MRQREREGEMTSGGEAMMMLAKVVFIAVAGYCVSYAVVSSVVRLWMYLKRRLRMRRPAV